MKLSWQEKRVLALLIILGIITFFSIRFLYPRQGTTTHFTKEFPTRIGDWKSRDIAVTPFTYNFLGTKDIITRMYQNQKTDAMIYFQLAAGYNNRDLLQPGEFCLLGLGDRLVESRTIKASAFIPEGTFLLTKNHKTDIHEVVLYWFKVGGRYETSLARQQIIYTLQSLTQPHIPCVAIRLAMKTKKDEITKTIETLLLFARDVFAAIEREPL